MDWASKKYKKLNEKLKPKHNDGKLLVYREI